MTDLLTFFADAQFPEEVYEWGRLSTELAYRGSGPRLAFWTFEGKQPLAGGLSALLGEFFRWRGSDYRLLVTRYGTDAEGFPTWDSGMLQITPSNHLPIWTVDAAHLWGELGTDTLTLHYQYKDDGQEWTLTGDLVQITKDLIALVPQILGRIGIRTGSWEPEEAFDITDATALEALLTAWGELNIRAELVTDGMEEYADALEGAIRRVLNAATIGSRYACWAATRALLPIASDPYMLRDDKAEDALVGLASVNPRVPHPSVALALIAWNEQDYQRAAELLETAVEADPRSVTAWSLLALLYTETSEIERAEQVYREAIAGNVADPTITFYLANLLLDHAGDTEEDDEAQVREAALLLEKAETDGLADSAVALRMMDAAEFLEDDELLWAAFQKVIDFDTDGSALWEIVEHADTYLDFDPGLDLLLKAAQAKNSYTLYAALTRALLRLNLREDAAQIVATLRTLATDDYDKSEAAQLALEAADPEFEDQFLEIISDLEEGMIPDSSVLDFLHKAVAAEPTFADAAVALSETYEAREEIEAAMAALTEARKALPNHLEIVLAMSDLLWGQDRDEEAEALLLETLDKSPQDVALLSRVAEYYYETGDDDQARIYLERAEALDPENAEFVRVSATIMEEIFDDFDTEGIYEEDDVNDADDRNDPNDHSNHGDVKAGPRPI